MFGRITPFIAMAALTTHLWVSMVVAPWHRLTEHYLAVVEPTENPAAEAAEIKAVRGCHCHGHSHRHAHRVDACAVNTGSPANGSESPSPVHNHDDCEVCQILAQHYQPVDVSAPQLTPERVDFFQPVVCVQPLLGCLTEPVSRGPPAA